MAFDRTGLGNATVGLGSEAPKLYTYRTNDAKADVIADDYFADAVDVLEVGDFIYASVDEDGVAVALVVTKATGAEVDTAYVAVA